MTTAQPFQGLSAWVHLHNLDRAQEAEVRARLAAAGIDLHSSYSEGQRHGVLCFSQFDEQLISRVRQSKQEGEGHILVLACGSSGLPSKQIWQLLRAGASEVFAWEDSPLMASRVQARLSRWDDIERLTNRALSEMHLVGEGSLWRTLVRRIVEAARFSRSPILLTGESGTGKELLARLVHSIGMLDESTNATTSAPVTLDCSTIIPELSGSELFGHEKGAFTGAVNSREGALALADGGSLFLDEIGELPTSLQLQLLRAVQEGTYKRVGGNTWQTTRFRLVCATNRDLNKLVQRGKFRLDLYHRIAGWVFTTLPLSERPEDILPLARYFLESGEEKCGASDFDPIVCEFLLQRQYPGNVRELRQLVQRMRQRHVGPGPITAGDIPEDDRPAASAPGPWPNAQFEGAITAAVAMGTHLKQITRATTETAIRVAVKSEKGNLQRAAKRLGVTDRALQIRRAKQVDIIDHAG